MAVLHGQQMQPFQSLSTENHGVISNPWNEWSLIFYLSIGSKSPKIPVILIRASKHVTLPQPRQPIRLCWSLKHIK
jgi:hypothetical protein